MSTKLAERISENKRLVLRNCYLDGIDAAPTLATVSGGRESPPIFAMIAPLRFCFLAAALSTAALAAPPAGLVTALEHLREQKSYSWEVINGDPGPVAHQFQTRRGTVTTVQQNISPNIKGKVDRQGNMLIVREWSDGLRLETVINADGTMITNTPEGWMTDREILTAQAEERIQNETTTPRFVWLRRADRPDIRRPDEELLPFLKSNAEFDFDGESYITHIRSRGGDPAQPNQDQGEPAIDVTLRMNLRNGVIRDYEVTIAAIRRATRARVQVPISEQRITILTYVPVSRIDLPEEARAKLQGARNPAGARSGASL